MSSGDSRAAVESAPALALPADLMFAARIRAAALAAGVPIEIFARPEPLTAAARDVAPRLVFIDLDARNWDPVTVIRSLRQDTATATTRIIAFVSHVRQDAIKAARAAGADRVMARSAFARELPELLRPARSDESDRDPE
jgi:CheY-like chemotaxis protein